MSSFAETRVSVRQTMGQLQFKEILKETEKKWTPTDIEAKVKSYYGYTTSPQWTPYKPFKDILNSIGADYVLEEYSVDLATGKKAPYFIARKSGTKLDGTAPALQVGLPSMVDYPLGTAINVLPQKLWLDKGGVVILTPINIEDPIVFYNDGDKEKQKQFQKFADNFGSVAQHILKTKKARQVHFEAFGDTFFMAVYTYLKYADVYSRVVLSNPDFVQYVASTVTEPTPKTWPDVLMQDWYSALLVEELKKHKKFPSVLIVTDSQKPFMARMAYAYGLKYKLPVEYMEIPQWYTKDVEAKTTRFYIIKYNYLFFAEEQKALGTPEKGTHKH
ncbi:MAG: hypothetical protein IT287_04175 [Bdellovibrionaceae bacterium]|nr:hypothetical protein [Pseudobdellovibrionaceae bacterium]